MRASARVAAAAGKGSSTVGARIRALRIARGLTQEQVGAPEFTRAYISLVESGKSGMSARATEIIAGRLGVSVADLASESRGELRQQLALARAEASLRAGRSADALRETSALERGSAGLVRARAMRVRGKALLDLGQPREALRAFTDASRVFEAQLDHEFVARTAFDRAQAHIRLQERSDALQLALRCEAALQAGALVDRSLELQVTAFLAGVLTTLGETTAATARADRARELAEDVTDPRTIANLYESLSQTREQQGDLEGALTYARRSLAAYERLGEERSIGRTWNTIGWVYLRRRHFDRAAEALDRADAVARNVDDGRLAAYVLQSRAELALARGRAHEALALAEASRSHPAASKRCRAFSLLVKAQALAATRAGVPVIDAAFKAAAAALRDEGREHVARAHREHFEALTRLGETKRAVAVAERAFRVESPR